MKIGITGSIGSGKTTVAKLFSKHRYTRIDADDIAHFLLRKDRSLIKRLTKTFGKKILGRKGINRKKLGDIVFRDRKKLKKLNSIIHPRIIKEMKKRISKTLKKKNTKPWIVVDAPLLLETKARKLVDKIVIVTSRKKTVMQRLKRRFTKSRIERILKRQMPLKKKLRYANFVIDNNKDLKHLEKQVKKKIGKLR